MSCFVLSEKWRFSKTSWCLVFIKTFWIPTLHKQYMPIHWYARQLVYSHDVINTNESLHFLTICEKVSRVLLRIEVALLNNESSQNIKINNLFVDIGRWSTFVKLVGNFAVKETILSRIWRNAAFLCDPGIFFPIFLLFVCL